MRLIFNQAFPKSIPIIGFEIWEISEINYCAKHEITIPEGQLHLSSDQRNMFGRVNTW